MSSKDVEVLIACYGGIINLIILLIILNKLKNKGAFSDAVIVGVVGGYIIIYLILLSAALLSNVPMLLPWSLSVVFDIIIAMISAATQEQKYFNPKLPTETNESSTEQNPAYSFLEQKLKRTMPYTDEEMKEIKEKTVSSMRENGNTEQEIAEAQKYMDEYFTRVNAIVGTPEEKVVLNSIEDISKIYPDYANEQTTDSNDTSFNKPYNNLDYMLADYIKQKLDNPKAVHEKNVMQLRISRIILSIITFLVITYIALYHNSIAFLVEIIAIVVYYIAKRKMNMVYFIIKDIKSRPNDNMDYIIESDKQHEVSRSWLLSALYIPLTLILCVCLYKDPHIIYEKNDTGYSVRYYSMAIFNESFVVIPDMHEGEPVNEIRGQTFYNLSFLESVTLPKNITEIRGDTFENSGITKIEIPEGVTRIGAHAFYGCKNLKEVKLPYSLKEIGSSAFRNCSSLHSVRIPSHTSVNAKAFKNSPTRIERYSTNEGEKEETNDYFRERIKRSYGNNKIDELITNIKRYTIDGQ